MILRSKRQTQPKILDWRGDSRDSMGHQQPLWHIGIGSHQTHGILILDSRTLRIHP